MLEDTIDGSVSKKKIDKTTMDWVHEWFNSLGLFVKGACAFVALLTGVYVLDFYGIVIHLPPFVQKMIGVLFFPIVIVLLIIILVRSVGIIMMIMFPAIQATDMKVMIDKITFTLKNGGEETVEKTQIERIIITYNYRGVFIHATKSDSYDLPLDPVEIEKRVDILEGFTKEVKNLDSKEGHVRTVFYEPVKK